MAVLATPFRFLLLVYKIMFQAKSSNDRTAMAIVEDSLDNKSGEVASLNSLWWNGFKKGGYIEEETLPRSPSQGSNESYFPEIVEWEGKDVDAILASELNQLSMKERERVYEEIHGVDEVIAETPEFVAVKLAALDSALRRIPSKPAYDQAESMSSEYVSDPKFRLMFLRADAFDAEKAAARLVMFMEEKKKMFGPQTLVRRIMLSDFSKDDMVCLKSGALQALPVRDRAGRAIMGNFRNLIPKCYKEVDNMVRVF